MIYQYECISSFQKAGNEGMDLVMERLWLEGERERKEEEEKQKKEAEEIAAGDYGSQEPSDVGSCTVNLLCILFVLM